MQSVLSLKERIDLKMCGGAPRYTPPPPAPRPDPPVVTPVVAAPDSAIRNQGQVKKMGKARLQIPLTGNGGGSGLATG